MSNYSLFLMHTTIGMIGMIGRNILYLSKLASHRNVKKYKNKLHIFE